MFSFLKLLLHRHRTACCTGTSRLSYRVCTGTSRSSNKEQNLFFGYIFETILGNFFLFSHICSRTDKDGWQTSPDLVGCMDQKLYGLFRIVEIKNKNPFTAISWRLYKVKFFCLHTFVVGPTRMVGKQVPTRWVVWIRSYRDFAE